MVALHGPLVERLAEEAFGAGNVEAPLVRQRAERGRLPLRARRLRPAPEELAARDRLYEVIVGVRAVKRAV